MPLSEWVTIIGVCLFYAGHLDQFLPSHKGYMKNVYTEMSLCSPFNAYNFRPNH